MEKDFTYSFIIPHKNSPDLLKRCVDSIPVRDDVQIIVVDDNSDVGKKPRLEREDIEIVLLDADHSKGAGRARNVGLEYAKGKWLLFADADDYYVDGFLNILDGYIDKDIDVLYYNYLRSFEAPDGILGKNNGTKVQKIVEGYDGSDKALMDLKYRNHTPWSKMVRRDYVVAGGFFFENVPNGNDTLFSYFVGYNTNKFLVEKRALYVYVQFGSSITQKKKNYLGHLSRLSNIIKNNSFYKEIGCLSWRTPAYRYIFNVLKHYGISEAIKVLWIYLINYRNIDKQKQFYVDKVIRKM